MTFLTPVEDDQFLESPLLSGIEVPAREAILRCLIEGKAAAGTTLIAQGQVNDRLWFVLDGSITLERRHPGGSIENLATLAGPAIYGTTTFFRRSAPSASLRAFTDLSYWTLDQDGHEVLRRDHPRAAEALALAVVRVLAERFDLLDAKLGLLMAEHANDHPRATELATFRARLFDEPPL